MREALLFIADCALKGTVVLAAAAVLAWLGRRRSAGMRHLIWLAAFLVLLMLPLGEAVVPARIGWLPKPAAMAKPTPLPDLPLSRAELSSLPPFPTADIKVAPIEMQTATPTFNRSAAALVVWGAGLLSVCLYVIVGLAATLRLRRRSVPYERKGGLQNLKQRVRVGRPVDARVNRGSLPEVAMTWGSLWPVILLPRSSASWPEEQEEAVLLHELAHVRRLDWLTQLLATFACALYWFNPAVWLAARRLRAESESSADDLVLRLGQCPSAYAASLLRVASELGARRPFQVSTGVTAMKSRKIEQRIQAILDPNRPRRGSTRLDLLAMAAVAAMVAVPLSGVKAQTPVRLALAPAALGQVDSDLVPVEKFYELSKGSHREVAERRLSGDSLVATRLQRNSSASDSVDIARLGDPAYIKRLQRRGVRVTVISEERADAIVAKHGGSGDRMGEAEARAMAQIDQKIARAERRMAEKQALRAEALARGQESKAQMMADRMRSLAKKQQALSGAQAEGEAKAELKEAEAVIKKRLADSSALQAQGEKAQKQAMAQIEQQLARQKAGAGEEQEQIAAALADARAAQKELSAKELELNRQGALDQAKKLRALSEDSSKDLIKSIKEQTAAQNAMGMADLLGEKAMSAQEMAQVQAELAKSFADQKLSLQQFNGADSQKFQQQLKQLQNSKDWIKLQGADSLKLQGQLMKGQDFKGWLKLQGADSLKLQRQLMKGQDFKGWLKLQGADSLKLEGDPKLFQDSKAWQKLYRMDSLKGSPELYYNLNDLQDRQSYWDRLAPSQRKARVDRAQTELAAAQREYDQLNKLYNAGAAPKSEVQKKRSKLDIARINLQIAKLMQKKGELEGRG